MAIQIQGKTYAFSGSRAITKSSPLWGTAQTQVVNFLEQIKKENGKVLVGDAEGIDALVAAEAMRMGVPVLTMGTGQVPRTANQNQFGELTKGFGNVPLTRAFEQFPALPGESDRSSYYRRDEEMVNSADVVIGIWNGQSEGTKTALYKARAAGKETFLFDASSNVVLTSDNQSKPMSVFWAEQMNTAKSNRAIIRDIWERVTTDTPGFNLSFFTEQTSPFTEKGRFQTTVETLDAMVDRFNSKFRSSFGGGDSLEGRAVSGLRDIAFNQKYDPAWNSIGGFSDPLKSGQQLKWRGGSGTFPDMLEAAKAAALEKGATLSYQVHTDNYGTYLETVLETRGGANRFYQKIRYNAQENVWISNSGSSNERVHTSRFTKGDGGAIAYQDLGYSLWDTLTNTKDSDFIKGFMLTSRDRVQTFLERKERMILGASLAEDMQPDNLFDINRTHDSMITGARKAMEDGGFPVGELVFQKGKANSSNPPSLMDLSRRMAGTSASTEKDYVRRTRDNALGYISYHGEVPELEWRSKVLFGNEVPMTGTVSRVASVFNPLFFGEGMGYTLGRPQLVEMQEVPLSPEAPIRRYGDFSQIGFMEVNKTISPRQMQEFFGVKSGRQESFLFGFANRGINDVVSSTSMLFARFHDATNMEAKPAAYSKNQMVGMSRGTALARAGQSVSGDRELNMITMSPIKPVRFLDETMDVWRSNAKDPISDMISAAVAAGKYKTEAEAKTAFYEDSQRGEITLVPSPDGSSYIPRFSRDSKWQAYAGVAALAWRYGQIETVTTNGPVQANSIDAIFKKINELNKTNISYERILKGEISYEELPFTAKNDLSKYGIKGWSSSLTQGVRFRIESAMDVSDRVMRGQRVKPNSSWNLTELDIDVLEAQQPEVATLFKDMYGANAEDKVRKFHAQRLSSTLNVRNKNDEKYTHFVKAGGIELDLSDPETLKYLNSLVALTNAKTASLVDMMGEKAPSKKNRSYNEMLDKKDGYQYEAYDISFGPEFVRALKEALGTDIIAIHSGNGMSSVIDLSALSGKKYEANPLAIAITTGNVDHNALSGIANRQLPEGVSKIGSVNVVGIATRAASAKVPPGVVVMDSRTAKQIINNMPISIDEKLRMMSDLDRGIPLEGIVRVQNFDRLTGPENQAVYTYEEAVKLWPEIKGDPVSSTVPVRVNALLPVAGSRDMDGDNLQLAFTSRRHVTAKDSWTDRQLGTPYPEGMLEQSVGGEFADMEKKALGLNSDFVWQGHMTNLQMLRDANNPEEIGKVMEQVEKLLKESKKAGDSLHEKYYANILMGYTYTTGTVVIAGMAQGDVQSGRNRYSPEQRFSMMHMPIEWYQESMDLKAITNMGVLSILNIRNDAKLDKDGNWLKPVDLMTDDEYNNYASELSSWKNAIKRNLKAGKRPHPGNVSEKELSDFLLREFLQVAGLEADDPKAKEYSKLLNKKYQSQIGESSFSKELAYMMLPNGTEAGDFDKLADLISQNKQDEAFSMIKLLHGDTEWLRGNSPMANYSLNMGTASQALLLGKKTSELAAMTDEEFNVFASLLSRQIKKGKGREYSNFFYLDVLKRAESLEEYEGSAFVQTLRSLAVTEEDREKAKENPYTIENLKKWVSGADGEPNAFDRTVAHIKKMISGFVEGGFTGHGGKFEPAGLVHKGEFVLTKEQVEHIKAGGIESVMNDVAKELAGGMAFTARAGSYAFGGLVGSNITFGQDFLLNMGMSRLPNTGASQAVMAGYSLGNVNPIMTAAGLTNVPGATDLPIQGQVTIDHAGRASYSMPYSMSVHEFKKLTERQMSYWNSGGAQAGADYLSAVQQGSFNAANFNEVTLPELRARTWDPAGLAVHGLGKNGRAPSRSTANKNIGKYGGRAMSEADWALGVANTIGSEFTASSYAEMSELDQIMAREALGVAQNINAASKLAMDAGQFSWSQGNNMRVGAPNAQIDRMPLYGNFAKTMELAGISAMSPVEAEQARRKVVTRMDQAAGISPEGIATTSSGLQALNKQIANLGDLLPKVTSGHKMYIDQVEKAADVFGAASKQLDTLREEAGAGVLTPENKALLDRLEKKGGMPDGGSIADYIDSNRGTMGQLSAVAQERRFNEALRQPFADMTREEKSDQLMSLLVGASSRSGKKRLADMRAMGIGDEGLEVAGLTIRGEGAQDAYGRFARGFNAVNNASTIWAMRSISSMIINPALESAAAYEQTAASMGRSMYSSGLMDYDELMGGTRYGNMIKRQQRREMGQYAYGQAVYGAYAPALDMFMSPEVAQGPLGLGAAIAAPAAGAGLLTQSVLGKMGMGMVAGLPIGALVAGATALYGVGATMGTASEDISAMASGGFYGSLGRIGSTLKTGISNLGIAPSSDWAFSSENARMSTAFSSIAQGMIQGRYTADEAIEQGAVLSRSGEGLFRFLGSVTGSETSLSDINARSVELAIQGTSRSDIPSALVNEFFPGVDRDKFIPGLGMSVNEAMSSVWTEGFEGTDLTNADLQQIAAGQWASRNFIPWTKDTMQSSTALYSRMSMYGLAGNGELSALYGRFAGTGINPADVIGEIAAPFASTDFQGISLAVSDQAGEYNRIMAEAAAQGIKMSPDAAITQATSSSQMASISALSQQLYGSDLTQLSSAQATSLTTKFGRQYAQNAATSPYQYEFQRSLMGGDSSQASAAYQEAVLSGDLTTQALLESMPSFYGASRTGAGGSWRQQHMESAYRTASDRYGIGYAGVSTAAGLYGLVAPTSSGTYESQLDKFTEAVVTATDSMIDINSAFENWLDITGQSFNNAEEGQKLFASFMGETGLSSGRADIASLSGMVGVSGGLQGQYESIRRITSGGLLSMDFSGVRDRALAQQIMGIAQTAGQMGVMSPETASQSALFSTWAMNDIMKNPADAAKISQRFTQGMTALGSVDQASTFGFTASPEQRTDLYNRAFAMSPTQFRVYQAAVNGDRYAQSAMLSGGSSFEGMTSFNMSAEPLQFGMGRYETGFDMAVDPKRIGEMDTAFRAVGLDYFSGVGGVSGMMADFGKTGIRGMQMAATMASYNAAAAQYGYSTTGRRIGLALTSGGASIDPETGFAVGGSNAGAAPLFSRMGMNFLPGNGMTYWQIEDAQTRIQRDRQAFGLMQQGQSLGISQEQFALAGRQFNEREAMSYRRLGLSNTQFRESMALRREQFEYGVGYQQNEMTIGRGIQMAQEGWRGEDLAYNRNMMEVQFGFQMRDANRNIRYARGRDRIDLMRQRDDATVLYSMQAGQADRQEGRHKTEMQWSAEEFKRREENFKKTTAFTRQEMALQEKQHAENLKFSQDELKLQRKHFEESRELEKKRLAMQEEAFGKEVAWMNETWKLEDQRRILDREHYIIQQKLQQAMADASMGAQARIKDLNLAMQGLQEVSKHNDATIRAMAFTSMPEWNSQLLKGMGVLKQIADILSGITVPGTPGGMSGGYIGDHGLIPQFDKGGYTGDGLVSESKGIIEVHGGEYVVPQKGTPVIRGDNPATVALLAEIRDELKKIREMGPGRVNATITTNQSKISTGDLMNAAYATRR